MCSSDLNCKKIKDPVRKQAKSSTNVLPKRLCRWKQAHEKVFNWEMQIKVTGDLPGGAVVKNLPASAGDTGSSPGPGRSHILQSN